MPSAAPVRCPRCAYDLSGEIARWESACPLAGQCTECGIALDWCVLFRPDLALTPGFVEHAAGFRRVFRSFFTTWLLTLLPVLFWSRVRLEAPVRLRRAMLWLAILLLVPRVLGSVLNTWWLQRMSGLVLHRLTATSVTNVWLDGMVWIDFNTRPPLYGSDLADSPPMVVPLILASIAPGLLLLALPWTLGAAKVRAVHVARATLYSLAWLSPLAAMYLLRSAGRVWAIWSAGASPSMGADLEGPLARSMQTYMFRHPVIFTALAAAWLVAWWFAAVIVNFRVRRPALLLALMTAVAILAATIGLSLNERLEGIVLGL